MSGRVMRWVAVPLAAIAGYALATWLFFDLAFSCLHFGSRPPGLCSDWWYANHAWVAAIACGVVGFVSSVLLPTILAPQYKRAVGVVAFTSAIAFTILVFESWVLAWVAPTLVLLAAISRAALSSTRWASKIK